jgi:predicted lactoylglutathione lyase
MRFNFPAAVPEIPVTDIEKAVAYYQNKLGFQKDWGSDEGGIAGISQGDCRIFLTNPAFRAFCGNTGPVLIWLNLTSKHEVSTLYERWHAAGATIVSAPEEKPWKLFEFTAVDIDGNLLRVFYDFSRDL